MYIDGGWVGAHKKMNAGRHSFQYLNARAGNIAGPFLFYRAEYPVELALGANPTG